MSNIILEENDAIDMYNNLSDSSLRIKLLSVFLETSIDNIYLLSSRNIVEEDLIYIAINGQRQAVSEQTFLELLKLVKENSEDNKSVLSVLWKNVFLYDGDSSYHSYHGYPFTIQIAYALINSLMCCKEDYHKKLHQLLCACLSSDIAVTFRDEIYNSPDFTILLQQEGNVFSLFGDNIPRNIQEMFVEYGYVNENNFALDEDLQRKLIGKMKENSPLFWTSIFPVFHMLTNSIFSSDVLNRLNKCAYSSDYEKEICAMLRDRVLDMDKASLLSTQSVGDLLLIDI